MKIHCIGVGRMGLPMATHLQAGGHAVSVSDPDEHRLRLARTQGLVVAEAPASALAAADVVLSSLPHDAALLSAGAEVAAAAQAGALYLDTSTVSPRASAEVARLLAARGIDYLRSTVSGNNKMAEAAQLTVMASGPRAASFTCSTARAAANCACGPGRSTRPISRPWPIALHSLVRSPARTARP